MPYRYTGAPVATKLYPQSQLFWLDYFFPEPLTSKHGREVVTDEVQLPGVPYKYSKLSIDFTDSEPIKKGIDAAIKFLREKVWDFEDSEIEYREIKPHKDTEQFTGMWIKTWLSPELIENGELIKPKKLTIHVELGLQLYPIHNSKPLTLEKQRDRKRDSLEVMLRGEPLCKPDRHEQERVARAILELDFLENYQ